MADTLDQYGRILPKPPILSGNLNALLPTPLPTRTGRVDAGTSNLPTNTPTATQAPRVIFGGQKFSTPPPPPAASTVANPPPPPPSANVAPPPQTDVTQPKVKPPEPTVAGVKISDIGTGLGIAHVAGGVNAALNDTVINTGALGGLQDWIDEQGVRVFGGAFATSGAGGAAIVEGGGFSQPILNTATGEYSYAGTQAAGATSLTNGLGYGLYGGTLAVLLGLGSGNFFRDTGSGLVGGVAGAAVGSALGTALGSAAGPLGAIVGGFALTAIQGAFGPQPSDRTAAGSYDPNTGVMTPSSLQGSRYSAQNNTARDAYFTGVKAMQAGLSSYFGGEFKDAPAVTLNVGGRDGARVTYGGASATFNNEDPIPVYDDQGRQAGVTKPNNINDSLGWVGKHMIMDLKNLPPDLETARKNIDYNQSFDLVTGDMNFAKDYRASADAMVNGTITMDISDPKALDATLTAFQTRADKLGLDPDYTKKAVDAVRNRRTS